MYRGEHKSVSVWAIALLLLLFQSGTLAHSHDELASGLDSCEICIHAQQTDDLAFPASLHTTTWPADTVFNLFYRTPQLAGVDFSHTPRAPPISL